MNTDSLIPTAFAEAIRERPADESGGVTAQAWLSQLPSLITSALDEWKLTLDGTSQFGQCALVLPVRRGRERLALKITWPHADARHEHLALQAWRGVGVVRLIAAHPGRWTLLLERCEPADELPAMSALDAAEIVGRLHARLRRPALPQLDTASAWCGRIGTRLTLDTPGLPRRMVQQGQALSRDLASDTNVNNLLVHTDLHDGNVMRATRANTVDGYVAIDPKPLSGELALAVAPLVWNRWDESTAAFNMRNHLRFRIDYACDPMGVEPERARAWTILRLLDNAWHEIDHARQRGAPSPPNLTKTIALIKAMQG